MKREDGLVSVEYAVLGVAMCAAIYWIASNLDLFSALSEYWDSLLTSVLPESNLLGK